MDGLSILVNIQISTPGAPFVRGNRLFKVEGGLKVERKFLTFASLCFYSKEVENLREENAKLQEQLEMYDLRKEQMHMQVCTPICWFEESWSVLPISPRDIRNNNNNNSNLLYPKQNIIVILQVVKLIN